MSSFIDLVKTRRSVRTFDGNGVSPEVLEDLKSFAKEITNPYGVQSIRFEFLDREKNDLSSPVLSGEKCYVSAVCSKEDHMEEAYGYAFQKLLMKAHELGLGTVWIGGTMPRDKFEKASKLAGDEFMPCMSPLGVTAKKMGIKESLMRKGVKADTRLKFEELFFVNDFNTPMTEQYAKENGLFDDLEAVRFAPSAVNKQPWRIVIDGKKAHFYTVRSIFTYHEASLQCKPLPQQGTLGNRRAISKRHEEVYETASQACSLSLYRKLQGIC